jgi:hypothetical protein
MLSQEGEREAQEGDKETLIDLVSKRAEHYNTIALLVSLEID